MMLTLLIILLVIVCFKCKTRELSAKAAEGWSWNGKDGKQALEFLKGHKTSIEQLVRDAQNGFNAEGFEISNMTLSQAKEYAAFMYHIEISDFSLIGIKV